MEDGLYWELEDVHYPDPPSRWGVRLMLEDQSVGIAELMAENGLLMDGVRFREHDGGVYVGFVPLGGKARKPPPNFLMPLLRRLHPEIRRRVKISKERQDAGIGQQLVDRWLDHEEDDLIAEAFRYLDRDLSELGDEALIASLDDALEYCFRALKKHFELHAAGINEIGMLGMELNQQHGFTTADIAGLLTGLSDTTTGPAVAQQEIVDAVDRVNAGDALANAQSLQSVRAISVEVDGLITAYLRDWSRRAIRYDAAYPTIAEQPDWVLARLKDLQVRPLAKGLSDAHDATREEVTARIVSALGDTAETRSRIERARRAFPIREGNEAATVGYPLAVARRYAQDFGRRLVAAGHIADHDHVFDLTVEECVAGVRGSESGLGELARTRHERRMAGRGDVPLSFGEEMDAPDLSAFPDHVGHLVNAMLWYTSKLSTTAPPAPDADPTAAPAVDGGVGGLGVSPGTYDGPARIVLDEDSFDRIEPGDVLVCPITSPVWSMVFPAIGALVCDAGGPLSHPAIIAREFAIPAVVGTSSGTADLVDGTMIRVDGDAGTVTPV